MLSRLVIKGALLVMTLGCVSPVLGLEDPTRPWGLGETTERVQSRPDEMQLHAIFERASAKHALINGVMLGEGESTEAFTLLEIKTDRVVIARSDGTRRELFLSAEIKEVP